jgi:sterol 14-demethylase
MAKELPPPPALPGLPLLGSLLEYRRDHVEVFRRGYETLGPVFSIRLGPQRAVVLIGPEYHQFYFSQADRALALPPVYRFVVPMFGKVLNAADTEPRLKQLAIVRHAFSGPLLPRYIQTMVAETRAWLDTLGPEGEFNLWSALESLGVKIATAALLGDELRARVHELVPLLDDLARGMEFVLPPNLPLPRFRRRDRARRRLTEIVRPMIEERQRHPDAHQDFLQTLANARYLDDSPMPDETIVGMTLMTAFTGYISTAAQTCWALVHLLQHPEYLAEVMNEQRTIVDESSEGLSFESLTRLERLEWALKETQRLRPVMSHYARYNAQSYELGGYRVPQGWLTMVCPAVAHRLPELFSNPDVYDPWRFAPGRAEDAKHVYSLIGFGGGVYRCPGSRFGVNEMKMILSLLLEKYTLELDPADPKPNYDIGIIRPDPACRVSYRRRPRHQRSAVAGDAQTAVA